jgi:hypothetical protein
MNNDPCMYHVSFLLNVGDRERAEGEIGEERWEACGGWYQGEMGGIRLMGRRSGGCHKLRGHKCRR